MMFFRVMASQPTRSLTLTLQALAYTYGFDSVADEYTAILEQREKEMGIESSVETVG